MSDLFIKTALYYVFLCYLARWIIASFRILLESQKVWTSSIKQNFENQMLKGTEEIKLSLYFNGMP